MPVDDPLIYQKMNWLPERLLKDEVAGAENCEFLIPVLSQI
jgi:hypothetical protein